MFVFLSYNNSSWFDVPTYKTFKNLIVIYRPKIYFICTHEDQLSFLKRLLFIWLLTNYDDDRVLNGTKTKSNGETETY